MPLAAEIDAHPALLALITSATRRSAGTFAELYWPPAPPPDVTAAAPGVVFESARRLVALQRVGGELRYYAGGKVVEDEPVTELSERGTFATVADALRFAVAYLADGAGLDAVGVPRAVRGRL